MSRAGVGGLPSHLLGRHVAERSQHDARLRAAPSPSAGSSGLPRLASLLRQLRQAEVEDLDPAVPRDEEVLGLQVPVDDPLLVRGGQAVRDLQRVVDRLARRDASAGERRAQRLAFEQLLHDVGRALVGPDVVDGRDVGVVQDAGRPAPPARTAAAGPRPPRRTRAAP